MQMVDYEFLHEKRDDISRFLAHGSSLEEAFTNAGRALFEVMAKPEKILPKIMRIIELKADTPQLLLFDWLDELLRMTRNQGFLAHDVRVQRITQVGDAWRLKARLRGDVASDHLVSTSIRSVAHEDTHIEEVGDRYMIQVTVKV